LIFSFFITIVVKANKINKLSHTTKVIVYQK